VAGLLFRAAADRRSTDACLSTTTPPVGRHAVHCRQRLVVHSDLDQGTNVRRRCRTNHEAQLLRRDRAMRHTSVEIVSTAAPLYEKSYLKRLAIGE